jgi:hypothetical protein
MSIGGATAIGHRSSRRMYVLIASMWMSRRSGSVCEGGDATVCDFVLTAGI